LDERLRKIRPRKILDIWPEYDIIQLIG